VEEEGVVERRAEHEVRVVVDGVQQHADPERLRPDRPATDGDQGTGQQRNGQEQRHHLAAAERLACPRRLGREEIPAHPREDTRCGHQHHQDPRKDHRRAKHRPTRIHRHHDDVVGSGSLVDPHCTHLFLPCIA